MKYLSLCCTLLIIQYCSMAQSARLEGKVSEVHEQELLAGAHVLLLGQQKVAVSDNTGTYIFNNIPYGTYQISVSYIGFTTIIKEIIIDKGMNILNFELHEQAYLSDEAIITASGTKVSRKDVLPAISVIPQATIEESKESALLNVVNEQVPGLFVTERGITGYGLAGGAAGKISIRGVGGNPNTGVLVLIDGAPQYMGLFGHPLPDSYVSSNAEKVEVIRGPASMMYGSNAMAGVINIISKQQKQEGLGARASLSYGSYNTIKIMGNAGYRKKNTEIYFSINHDQTDGHRAHSSFKITNGYLKISQKLGEHFKVSADGSIASFNTEDPGPLTDSTYIIEKQWIDVTRSMFNLSFDNNFKKVEGSAKFFYNLGKHKIYDGFISTDHNYGFSIYETYTPVSGSNISFGIDYKNYGGKAENTKVMMGQGMVFVDTSLYEFGGYLMLRQTIAEKWILTSGIRLNHQNTSGNEWVPQLGINYLISPNAILKASISKGFRYPTIRELFMWQAANPQLNSERMWCYEGSFLGGIQSINTQFEVTLYYQHGDNLIQSVGQYPNEKYENTGDFRHYGIEFAGSWNPFDFLTLESNYSWLHMEDPIIGAPVHQWYSAVRVHHKKATLKLSGMYIHGLYTQSIPEITENYYLLNANISYQALSFLNVWIRCDNLLDVEYEINYNYPMPGITVLAGIDVKLQRKKRIE